MCINSSLSGIVLASCRTACGARYIYRLYKCVVPYDCDCKYDIAYISCYTGEHRAELQGSNAIHEILKERIAFLSGTYGYL